MAKKYFEIGKEEEGCVALIYYKQIRKYTKQDILLNEAEISYGDGTFYCTEVGGAGIVGDGGCGRLCEKYIPRNGKNGRCKFSHNTYEPTGKKFRLTAANKLTPITNERVT